MVTECYGKNTKVSLLDTDGDEEKTRESLLHCEDTDPSTDPSMTRKDKHEVPKKTLSSCNAPHPEGHTLEWHREKMAKGSEERPIAVAMTSDAFEDDENELASSKNNDPVVLAEETIETHVSLGKYDTDLNVTTVPPHHRPPGTTPLDVGHGSTTPPVMSPTPSKRKFEG